MLLLDESHKQRAIDIATDLSDQLQGKDLQV